MHRGLRTLLWGVALCTAGLAIAGFAYSIGGRNAGQSARHKASSRRHAQTQPQPGQRVQEAGNLALLWDGIPAEYQQGRQDTGDSSNIYRRDYAGPDACQNCHKQQYAGWSQHPHRWMNARAEGSLVKGDFSDRRMAYLGGEVTFTKVDDSYRMRLKRGDIRREYAVDQTIGSRFFQYYVGKQLRGPEPSEHPVYTESHVLPLGYWLDRQEWVPVVHVHDDFQDRTRYDPFAAREFSEDDKNFDAYAAKTINLYRAQCNHCHDTFPLGDMFIKYPELLGSLLPTRVGLSLPEYIRSARPALWPADKESQDLSPDVYLALMRKFAYSDAREHAVTLGISCEACHLGARQHAEGKLAKPKFFPNAPEIVIRAGDSPHEMGRTHDNVNWACGRCHNGQRPRYAGGMATWNSTESTDAQRGHCYSELTCIRCHNPHEAIGPSWPKSPHQDDAICLSCHTSLEPEKARMAHTRHTLAGEGSRCMNCHMPRINEGLQDVVRTHTIFSPTNRAMIESNQMNACNQCHVDQPIDWTLTHLKEWYGATYDRGKIAANYPDRKLPATINWLRGKSENVRLVAADSLTRANATWALPDVLKALDDPFLLNRQFARIGIERMLGILLSDFSYQFYMTPEERREPLRRIREKLLPVEVQAETTARQE
jgi:predicted CXXCH cytochrome family protein